MKKFIRKIGIILLFTTLLTTTNCLAVTQNLITKDNINYIQKIYEVKETEESAFISNIENEFDVNNTHFVIETINKTGGTTTDTIDITTTKEITTSSNSIDSILSKLSQIIEYAEDGYIGEYKLDISSLETITNYNGYRTILVEDTKQYFDLNKNDLTYIQKQIKKDGTTLDLIKIEWYEQSTKLVGEHTVSDKYRAECYYAGKKNINNPSTYTTIATYKGTATKVIESPFIYELMYKEIIIPEEKNTNYIPYIIGGTGAIFTAVIILIKKKRKTEDKEEVKQWKKD